MPSTTERCKRVGLIEQLGEVHRPRQPHVWQRNLLASRCSSGVEEVRQVGSGSQQPDVRIPRSLQPRFSPGGDVAHQLPFGQYVTGMGDRSMHDAAIEREQRARGACGPSPRAPTASGARGRGSDRSRHGQDAPPRRPPHMAAQLSCISRQARFRPLMRGPTRHTAPTRIADVKSGRDARATLRVGFQPVGFGHLTRY